MRFSDALRLAADWQDFVETNDPAARDRLIHQGKPMLDEAIQAASDWLRASDETAVGMLLDTLAEKARKTAFFGHGPG